MSTEQQSNDQHPSPSTGSGQAGLSHSTSSGPAAFWQELKRRKVMRVAITYIIATIAIIEFASATFGWFDIPVWAFRLVTLCVVCGFPIAVIIAWAFELTPEGVKTTRAADEARGDAPVSEVQLRKRNWFSLIFAAGVPTVIFGTLAVFFYFGSDHDPQLTSQESPNLSVDTDRRLWATEQLLEIKRLQELAEHEAAFTLATEVVPLLADDTVKEDFWSGFSWSSDIETDPPGARVYRQAMDAPADEWEDLGTAPLTFVRFPRHKGYRLRFELEGYRTAEILQWSNTKGKRQFPIPFNPVRLDPIDVLPEEMVRIAGFTHDLVDYSDYFMDRYEVRNRDYEKFVAAGGYKNREFWTYPFKKEGADVSWEEAMASFVDQTGRPGPANWVGGVYPSGQGDYPVGGVSWFEAAAYAKYVDKELPAFVHWEQATRFYSNNSWLIASRSNLDEDGPRPVGENRAMTTMGVYDLVGNVREWNWNEAGTGVRGLRGGAWSDSPYQADWIVPKSPWEREASFGFRLVKSFDNEEKLARLRKRQEPVMDVRDYSNETPASDAEFQIYKRLYAYDPHPLNADVVEIVEFEQWTREQIEFDLPYGERGTAYFYLPVNKDPPYKTVVLWPGSGALNRQSVDEENLDPFIFLVRSGMAIAQPVYKGTYHRDDSDFSITNTWMWTHGSPTIYRDFRRKWQQDLSRTIDYLETREEFDSEDLGYFGTSWGGYHSPIALTVEGRLKVAVINSGGLVDSASFNPLPESDPFNFVTRVRVPILMLNGAYDQRFPLETSQKPMFDHLGTDPQHKKFISVPSSHTTPRNILIRETLAWFDKYLKDIE